MDAVAVMELKMQLGMLVRAYRHDFEFLHDFAQGGCERCFSRVDFAARSVDFSGAEAAFFADQENSSLVHDEDQIYAGARLPGCPVDHVAR